MRAVNYAAVAKIALLTFVVLAAVSAALIWGTGFFVDATLRGGSVGDLMTFNNRVELWRIILPSTLETLLRGHGYAMISDIGVIRIVTLVVTQHAHNGYLQVLAGTGIIGLALVVWFLAKMVRLFRRGVAEQHPAVLSFLAIFVAFLANNMVEASIGFQILPQFVLMFVLANVFYFEHEERARTESAPRMGAVSSSFGATLNSGTNDRIPT